MYIYFITVFIQPGKNVMKTAPFSVFM